MRILALLICGSIVLQGCTSKCSEGLPPARPPLKLYIVDSSHQFRNDNLDIYYVSENKKHGTEAIVDYPYVDRSNGNLTFDTTRPFVSFDFMLRDAPDTAPRDWYLDYKNGQIDTLTVFTHESVSGSGNCASTYRNFDSVRYKGILLKDVAFLSRGNMPVYVLKRN